MGKERKKKHRKMVDFAICINILSHATPRAQFGLKKPNVKILTLNTRKKKSPHEWSQDKSGRS